MNIVIPMAGAGSRMADRYGGVPKPFIDVAGRPMVAWALDGLNKLLDNSRLVFVILADHDRDFQAASKLRQIAGDDIRIVQLDKVTEGQLCTVIAAAAELDLDDDLLIASCDTWVVSNLDADIENRHESCRGIISVADMPGDRWSFAKTDQSGRVVQVTEKVRISNHASTGLYYFSNTGEFISQAKEIIDGREKLRGEYYVIAVYDGYIRRGLRIDISIADQMWDLGTPDALDHFLNLKAL